MSSGRPPMLINLPPPPSDPATPNEQGPGTPNSTTTSLSALSVIAIKDGAIGHSGRGSGHSANTLEAERADRISRLAGLERVATVRATSSGNVIPGGGPQLDNAVPHMMKERSTVGSASATGSVGGRTTWASESIDNDPDKMSEDQDEDASSTGGFSDEDKSSLVGFGEGANSTVSGPVSTANARMIAARQNLANPINTRTGAQPTTNSGQSTPMSGVFPTGTTGSGDPRLVDGLAYDSNVVDTTIQTPQTAVQQEPSHRFSGVGTEMAESIMKDRMDDTDPNQMMSSEDRSLGKFAFERDGQ